MRKFSSYGPVDKKKDYYVKREDIIDKIYNQLIDGHYITVWAPRQCGKTWIMNEVYHKIFQNEHYIALKIELENLKMINNTEKAIKAISKQIISELNLNISYDFEFNEFDILFTKQTLEKSLILILYEFDFLNEETIYR